MMSNVTTTRAVRATDLSTKRDVLAVFVRRASPRVLAACVAALVAARVSVGGGFGLGDVVVLAVTLAIAGPVEWLIHRFLLHAPDDAWTSRRLGTGRGHREHHLDPPDIDWLMLRSVDAGVFVAAFGVITAGWTFPLLLVLGSPTVGPYLTAWTLAAIGLLHYEWVHLLVHTRHRCRTRYYARLARNHRRHHYRNERFWLGVTTNSGDRLLRTYPGEAASVPVSDTARTLT